MTKEQKAIVTEYVSDLSDGPLRELTICLVDRLQDDLATALNFMSQNNEMDALLASMGSANDLFNTCDQIRDFCTKECKRRGVSLKYQPNCAA